MLSYGWQSDRESWHQISEDLLLANSWHYVGFSELNTVSVPKGESGVYMLCSCPIGHRFPPGDRSNNVFANLLTPMYIGKTTDLRERFLNHCRNPSVKVKEVGLCFGEALVFWFCRLPVERIAYEEAVLIKCFGPPANVREEAISASVGAPIPIGTNVN